jgi:hypothetical protein
MKGKLIGETVEEWNGGEDKWRGGDKMTEK